MILDWNKTCEDILLHHKLKVDDPSDNKIRFKQEVIYLVFLKKVKHLTDDEIYSEWLQLDNGVASLFRDDPEEQRIEFRKMYSKASQKRYQEINITESLLPIKIYQSEINFLNQLDVPKWVKEYWACLLFYYKFAHQSLRRVQKTPTLNAWAIRHTSYKRKNYGGNCQDRIAQYQKSLPKRVINDYVKLKSEKYPTYIPNFLGKSGKNYYKYSSADQIDDFLELIQENSRICTECGAIFTVNSRTQRTLCPKCYAEHRKKQIRENSLRYYHNK